MVRCLRLSKWKLLQWMHAAAWTAELQQQDLSSHNDMLWHSIQDSCEINQQIWVRARVLSWMVYFPDAIGPDAPGFGFVSYRNPFHDKCNLYEKSCLVYAIKCSWRKAKLLRCILSCTFNFYCRANYALVRYIFHTFPCTGSVLHLREKLFKTVLPLLHLLW